MYSIIIVDDEPGISGRLKTVIGTLNENFTVAGEAANGLEALKLIEKHQPELVITDIKMPLCDGLELSRILNEKYPAIIKIIISGYDDFSYAKEAIKYNVRDYLLKPINFEELRELLAETERKLNEAQGEMRLSEYLVSCISGDAIIMNCLNDVNCLIEAMQYGRAGMVKNIVGDIVKFIRVNQISPGQAQVIMREVVRYCCLKLGVNEFSSGALSDVPENRGEEQTFEKLACSFESAAEKLCSELEDMKSRSRDDVISEMLRYVNEHYTEDVSLTTLSEIFNLNANYISSVFKERTDWNFKEYISKLRLNQAIKLLTEEKYSIAQISAMVGFETPGYFGRFFKKYVGISPERYRIIFSDGNSADFL